jgi:hypothetical protein
MSPYPPEPPDPEDMRGRIEDDDGRCVLCGVHLYCKLARLNASAQREIVADPPFTKYKADVYRAREILNEIRKGPRDPMAEKWHKVTQRVNPDERAR